MFNDSNLFREDGDEERLCQMLKIYVEEYGKENVVVTFPKGWETTSSQHPLGVKRMEFTNKNSIDIKAEFNGKVEYCFSMELA